jgi:replicative DNA helicase
MLEARSIAGDNAGSAVMRAFSTVEMGASLDGYAEQLRDQTERRVAIKLLEDGLERLKSGKGSASDHRFRLSNALQQTRGRIKTRGLDEYVGDVEQHLRDVQSGKIPPVIPWYIPKLDRAIGGLQQTLILIGAEPGVGKSALIAGAVNMQAVNGHKPLVVSLEDEPSWLAWRVVSNDTGKNQFDLRFSKVGTGTIDEIVSSNSSMKSIRSKIRTIDGSSTGMKIEDLISSIKDSIVNEGVDSVWLDHLGEIQLTNKERPDLEISRHLSLLRG